MKGNILKKKIAEKILIEEDEKEKNKIIIDEEEDGEEDIIKMEEKEEKEEEEDEDKDENEGEEKEKEKGEEDEKEDEKEEKGKKIFKCPICYKKFNTRFISNHIFNRHENIKERFLIYKKLIKITNNKICKIIEFKNVNFAFLKAIKKLKNYYGKKKWELKFYKKAEEFKKIFNE